LKIQKRDVKKSGAQKRRKIKITKRKIEIKCKKNSKNEFFKIIILFLLWTNRSLVVRKCAFGCCLFFLKHFSQTLKKEL